MEEGGGGGGGGGVRSKITWLLMLSIQIKV